MAESTSIAWRDYVEGARYYSGNTYAEARKYGYWYAATYDDRYVRTWWAKGNAGDLESAKAAAEKALHEAVTLT